MRSWLPLDVCARALASMQYFRRKACFSHVARFISNVARFISSSCPLCVQQTFRMSSIAPLMTPQTEGADLRTSRPPKKSKVTL